MQLREYQTRGIDLLREHVAQGLRKVVLAVPTAAGKSYLSAQIIANALEKGKTVLWLIHRRNLVHQFRSTLEEFGITPGIIMSGIESDTKLPCQICTIQTYSRRLDLDATYNNRFFIDADLVLVDEAQRSISKTYQDVLSLYHDKIIIGTTATPMGPQGRGLGEVYESIIDVVGVKELTNQGYLAPVRYFAPASPDLEGVKIAMGDYVIKQLDKRINKPKLNGDVVENWLKYGEDKQTIVFCINVKHSVAICEEFVKRGVAAEHLDARSSDEERDDVFRRMKAGDTRVVCNVALYQEGLNTPAVENVVIARPTKSIGLYRQMCGRGMRIAEGKDSLRVFDHGNVINEHGFLEDEVFWNLSGKEIAWRKAPKADSEPKLCKCKACSQIFKGGKVCPRCGSELQSFGRKIEASDVELTELKKKRKSNRDYDWVEKRQFMGMLQYLEQKKNWNPGRKAHLYKLYFGVFPNDNRVKSVSPIMPNGKIGNLVKHVLIKSVKQYQKKQRDIQKTT